MQALLERIWTLIADIESAIRAQDDILSFYDALLRAIDDLVDISDTLLLNSVLQEVCGCCFIHFSIVYTGY